MTRNLTRKDVQKYVNLDIDMVRKWAKDHLEYNNGDCEEYESNECNECGLCEYYNGDWLDIKNIILNRLINYCYVNDIGITGYSLVLQNIVHETNIQYLIAEKYLEENKDEIIREMIEYERKGKTETSNQGSVWYFS